MKILSTISVIFLIELIYLKTILSLPSNLDDLKNKCIEFTNPLNRYESKVVDCPTVESSLDKRASSNDMFAVNFHCGINDRTLCNRVENVFVKAGRYITATLNLKTVINVNAQFLDLCRATGECDPGRIILGAAKPTRMIPNQDPDGKIRYYPQALYKQLNINKHPEFGSSDITATFNSKMDYWFEGDSSSMTSKKVDILYIVLHELIHGLGFTNSWSDYANIKALTPAVGITKDGTPPEFFEFVFDKHLVLLPSGRPLTSVTDELNQFKSNSASSPEEFFKSFAGSPQFPISQDMYKNSTTHGSIGFLLTPDTPPNANTELTQDKINNDVVILETSFNPYDPGSSIGHVDLDTYLDSSDFLMTYTYPPGKSLDEMMSKAGSTDKTGPIGPKLRRLLGVIGYEVKDNYTPPVNNSSPFISFNFELSLLCILLTLINNFYF